MSELYHTPLHSRHVALAAKMVDFAGWDMPVQYPTGIVAEHLATRKTAGLFDVSHLGRLAVGGPGAAAWAAARGPGGASAGRSKNAFLDVAARPATLLEKISAAGLPCENHTFVTVELPW